MLEESAPAIIKLLSVDDLAYFDSLKALNLILLTINLSYLSRVNFVRHENC